MSEKQYWKDAHEYRRILEILYDYWLTEKNEDLVEAKMYFIKGKEWQTKRITWINPDKKSKLPYPKIINVADALRRDDEIKKALERLIKSLSEKLQIDEEYIWNTIEGEAYIRRIESDIQLLSEEEE